MLFITKLILSPVVFGGYLQSLWKANGMQNGGHRDDINLIDTDILIVGAGAAGLRAAIELAREGVEVLVLGKRRHGDAHTVWAAGGINASLGNPEPTARGRRPGAPGRAGAGVEVLVLGKRRHGDAHTVWAAGGINASMGNLDPNDRWEIHAADTIGEGHFVNDPRAVEILAREAPDRILELRDWGCPFSLTEDGELNQRYFGAQTLPRTCFAGARTRGATPGTLVDKAREEGVSYREDVYVTKLLKSGGRVNGAAGFDMQSGRRLVFGARAVVLAAGGYTSIYRRGSSRADENNGDAMALAYEAGAALKDMEFVQFHPTGMIEPAEMDGRLVTEAVRGEGGRLYSSEGERFMERYSPRHMELDARDVVARANYREIRDGRGTPAGAVLPELSPRDHPSGPRPPARRAGANHREAREGRGTPDGAVLLDISHRDPDYIKDRLPNMYEQFVEQEVDITEEPMKVSPTAHYGMGGIEVDPRTGATAVEGLFAVGESTAGVHGANRLGGNSLAETVVFGKILGSYLAYALDDLLPPVPLDEGAAREHFAALDVLAAGTGGGRDPEKLIDELRDLVWVHAGIVRTGDGLREGLTKLRDLQERG